MIKNWGDHSGRCLVEQEGIFVIECERCRFKHIIPLPEEAEKREFYEQTFYSEYSEDYIAKHARDADWWLIEHNEKYDKYEALLGHQAPYRLLDIGSGPGYFLKAGNDRGWLTRGIEPGEAAWRYSTSHLGLDVAYDYFTAANFSTFGTFDVVHMNNVLEHIVDVTATIEQIGHITREGGLIAITVPNDFNPLQTIAAETTGKGPWWVVPEQHINYFNLQSLQGLLRRSGFEPVYHTTSFPLEMFLLMGDDYIGDNTLGRAFHQRRKRFEMVLDRHGKNELKRAVYDAFSALGIGRQVTVLGRKNA